MFAKVLFTIFMPLNPPPPPKQHDGFPLEFLVKEPQTEFRTLSQKCEHKIMNKQAFLNVAQTYVVGGLYGFVAYGSLC